MLVSMSIDCLEKANSVDYSVVRIPHADMGGPNKALQTTLPASLKTGERNLDVTIILFIFNYIQNYLKLTFV